MLGVSLNYDWTLFLSVVFVMHFCGYHRKTTLCLQSRWLCPGKYLNIRVVPRNLAASTASSRHVVHAPLSAGTPQRQTRCPRRPLPGSRNRRTQGARPPLSSPSVSEVCLEPLSPEGSMQHNHCNLHLTSRQGWIVPHTYAHFPMGRYLASVGFSRPAFNGDFLKYEKILKTSF